MSPAGSPAGYMFQVAVNSYSSICTSMLGGCTQLSKFPDVAYSGLLYKMLQGVMKLQGLQMTGVGVFVQQATFLL